MQSGSMSLDYQPEFVFLNFKNLAAAERPRIVTGAGFALIWSKLARSSTDSGDRRFFTG